MSKRKGMRFVGGTTVCLLAVACATAAAAVASPATHTSQLTVGLVLPGPTNDGGYNQGNYAGLQVAKKLGAKVSFVANAGDPAAALDAMKNLAAKNRLVLIAGGQYADVAKTAAKAFPKTDFVVLDGVPSGTPLKNLHAYLVAEWQPGYLAGALAARISKTHVIGYIGGLDIPTSVNTGKGYTAGAKSVVKSTKVLTTSIGSFDDVAKAKEAASAQIASGADVLETFLDAANPGVYSAIADSGKNVKVIVGVRIHSVCSQSKYVGGWTLANYGKRVQVAVQDFQKSGGKLPAIKTLGMETPNVEGVTLCKGTGTPALAKMNATISKGIATGKIKRPF